MNVLVIEDDPVRGEALHNRLTSANHSCVWVQDAHQGIQAAWRQKDDAIVLGLKLHEATLGTLELIRGRGVRTPVIALTAPGSVDQRVAALKAGADDCMVKPIAVVELLARLQTICRRALDRPAKVLQAGNVVLDLTNRRIKYDHQEIGLTQAEFNLVELLFRSPGKVVGRKVLAEHLGRSPRERSSNAVQVHVNRLRNKLRDGPPECAIATVRGRGYMLRSDVS